MINRGEENIMTLREEDLARIGRYVQEKLPEWLESVPRYRPAFNWEMEMRERSVRVEEELKSQRELMKQGFDMMDKRFEEIREDTNRRFEQVDKRFEMIDKRFEQFEKRFTLITALITAGFAMVTILITVYKFVA